MSDCISRQAVQDYIAKYLSQFLYNDVREAVETIDAYIGDLPSVTPTVNAIPIPNNATNGDVIKAMFPNEGLYEQGKACIYYGMMRFDTDWWNAPYENTPSETPTERTGHWKRRIVDSGYNADWKCSECGHKEMTDFPTNYCPNCGCRMQESVKNV